MLRFVAALIAVASGFGAGALASSPTQAERAIFDIERSKLNAIHETYFPAIRDLGIATGRLTGLRRTDFKRNETIEMGRKAVEAHADAAKDLDDLVEELTFSTTSSDDFNAGIEILLEVTQRSPNTVRRLHEIATHALEAAEARDVQRLAELAVAFSKLGIEQNTAEIELMKVDRLLLPSSSPARGFALAYIGSLEGLNAFASLGASPPKDRLRTILALPAKVDDAVAKIDKGIAEASDALALFQRETNELGEDQVVNGASVKSIEIARRNFAKAVTEEMAVEREMRDLFASAADLARRLADGEKTRELRERMLSFDPTYAELMERRMDAVSARERAGDLMRSVEN